MNIFILDEDPIQSAKMYCDKHEVIDVENDSVYTDSGSSADDRNRITT